MKIPKLAVHIVCIVFEVIFAACTALGIYYATIESYWSITHQSYSLYDSLYEQNQIQNALFIIIPLALLCLIVIGHVVYARLHKKDKKAKKIEKLQSKLDELTKDGE